MASPKIDKLRFRVVYFSSEDPEYPASQINTAVSTTRGWQTARYCSYPQELGLQLLNGPMTQLMQIQILSDNIKIARRVELFVGNGPSYSTANFQRLGFMSLKSNENVEGGVKARELKTAFVNNSGEWFRLRLHEPHPDRENLYKQVGLIGVSLVGLAPTGGPSNVGMPGMPSMSRPAVRGPYSDMMVDITLDPATAAHLRQLSDAKSRAIAAEDYATAKAIKNVELEVRAMGTRLAQLDAAKAEAVANEDYDLAASMKEEGANLRAEFELKIRTMNIPGVDLNAPVARREYTSPARQLPVHNPHHQSPPVGPSNYPPHQNPSNYSPPLQASGSYETHPPVQSSRMEPMDNYPLGITESDMERPIRVKQIDYGKTNDSSSLANPSGPRATAPVEDVPQFDPHAHPLRGVPNFMDLPAPEELSAASQKLVSAHNLSSLDEYIVRCLFSRNWPLREAALLRINILLEEELGQDISSTLAPVAATIKLGIDDKLLQVFTAAVGAIPNLLHAIKTAKLPRSTTSVPMDHIITSLIDRLHDSTVRFRDGTRSAIDILSKSPIVGVPVVSAGVMKPLTDKQKLNFKIIAARLKTLLDLLQTYGINSGSLSVESILSFIKSFDGFSHGNNEVRELTKEIVVSIHQIVGRAPLADILKNLRKAQLEEYETAFAGGDSGASAPSQAPAQRKPAPTPAPTSKASATESPRPMSSGGRPQQHESAGGSDEFTSCMFCSASDRNWTESDLDLHYWKDCPLLISCPACAQIVEVAGLPEHLLDECKHKGTYVPCETTGLAIRVDEFDSWQRSPACRPAPDQFMYCPLCLATVEDSDDAWLQHLSRQCKKNSRIR